MSKGLETRFIVLIALGLLILAIVGTLVFLGVGPFRHALDWNTCKGKAMMWCSTRSLDFDEFMKGCLVADNPSWSWEGSKGFVEPADPDDFCSKIGA